MYIHTIKTLIDYTLDGREDVLPTRHHDVDCEHTNHTRFRVDIGESMNLAYKKLTKKVLRVVEAEGRCGEIRQREKELLERKRADWKERIEMLPEMDLKD